ncbi:hypothetical protein [Beijerinckia sp. L45]|uniref:hypothetical protein n=1 Tax=Beijerinckia sp. L45 TaxID=1641855 RepID=UPI00131DFF3D|nr:hypothetical protein [Beijerinckia sp. L45]
MNRLALLDVRAKADLYFAEQCRRLGPIEGVAPPVQTVQETTVSDRQKLAKKSRRKGIDSRLDQLSV